MPKGKKYTAAEAHFMKEKEKLLKELKIAREDAAKVPGLNCEIAELKNRIAELEKENANLLSKLDMSAEERERELRNNERIANLASLFNICGRYL